MSLCYDTGEDTLEGAKMPEWNLIFDQSAAMTGVGETTALAVDNDYLYCTYTDRWLNAVLAKRNIAGGNWEYTHIANGVLNDAHNGSSVGIDPQGYIHVVWDIHSRATINYKKSRVPGYIHDLRVETLGGVQPTFVSYARFYRAGNEFYLLLRVGYSGNGDEWIKRWTPNGWVDIAVPLISGKSQIPTDNPYMGCCIGTQDGCLHIVWTHRVSYYNYGVYYARFDPASGSWYRADRSTYTLPMTRENVSQYSVTDPLDGTISNNGLGVSIDSLGRPNIVFSKHINGHAEVFYARYENEKWNTRQITNLHLPRLRACPSGPIDGDPRPCDYELQGPFIAIDIYNQIHIYYSRSVGKAGLAWQRPPAILYESVSSNAKDWKTREIKLEVGALTGEIIRESNGRLMFLVQEVSQSFGKLWLWEPTQVEIPSPVASVSARLPMAGTQYLELDNSDIWSCSQWTISAWINPEDVQSTMALIDKGGPLACREFRLLLWGNAPPFVYDPSRVQILMGGPSGWELLHHPTMEVKPGLITHLVLVYNGEEVQLFKNGEIISTVMFSTSPSNKGSKVLIGASRNANGEAERFYNGELGIEFYDVALDSQAVKMLYEFGQL